MTVAPSPRALLELADAASAPDFPSLVARLQHVTRSVMGARGLGLMLFDADREVLHMVPGSFGVDVSATDSCQVDVRDGRLTSADVFTTRCSYLCNDAGTDPRQPPDYLELLGIRRIMSLALSAGESDTARGVIHLVNKRKPFTSADLALAEAVVPRVASVVEAFQRSSALRRRQQLDAILARTAVGIVSGASVDALLEESIEQLADVIDVELLALVPTDRPTITARRGPRDAGLERRLLKADGPCGAAVVPPGSAGDPGRSWRRVESRLADRRTGVLAAVRHRAASFTTDEADALTRMADVAALAWASEGYARQRAEVTRLRERQRIADGLHDTVGQILFAAQMDLEQIMDDETLSPEAAATATHARSLLLRGDAAIREVIHQLARPPRAAVHDRIALIAAGIEEEHAITVDVDIPDGVAQTAGGMSRPASDVVVRAAREALVNAAKHAGRCRVVVQLRISRAGRMVLTVRDDGPGIDRRRRRGPTHGLDLLRRELREHGGQLRVGGGAAGGTTVTASVPF
ncbi:MAG: GAF domain-containing sensor histidine kinase [Solirubrobacteraceae bacterium]